MTAKPPPEFFADLRSRLTTLLEASSRWLRPDQLAIVSELIEVNEGGLALEMVSEMLCEVHATLDDGTVSSATELAERMGLPSETRGRVERELRSRM
jgi:hypothetical protein